MNQAGRAGSKAVGGPSAAWSRDVRIRTRPGRPDSGVKLYVTDHIGRTAREFMANTGFFRYPELFAGLVGLLEARQGDGPFRVLMSPLSVGLEAASLVIAGIRAGLFSQKSVVIEGLDISNKATELARTAVYPRIFFPADLSPYAGMLTSLGDGFVRLEPAVTDRLTILPAGDLLEFAPAEPYDLIVCLNLLMHVPEEVRPRLVERLAAMTSPQGGILCLNNNQEWPEGLAPHYRALTSSGFVSLHDRMPIDNECRTGPEFAVCDARALILQNREPGRY